MRILMLEDDHAISECLGIFLCDVRQGNVCDAAKTVEEAQALIRKNYYDVILIDLIIRGIPCESFIEYAMELQPQAHICLMSARRGADKIAKIHNVNSFLSKPFDLDKIEELLFCVSDI